MKALKDVYTVWEYTGNRYWPIKSFETLGSAREEAARLSYKAKITRNGKKVR